MHSIRVAYRIGCEDLCTGAQEIQKWLQHHWGAWLPFLPVTKDPPQGEGTKIKCRFYRDDHTC